MEERDKKLSSETNQDCRYRGAKEIRESFLEEVVPSSSRLRRSDLWEGEGLERVFLEEGWHDKRNIQTGWDEQENREERGAGEPM